jgi:hypothetical protein
MSEDDIVYVAMPVLEDSPLENIGWISLNIVGILLLGSGVGGMIYVFMNYVI